MLRTLCAALSTLEQGSTTKEETDNAMNDKDKRDQTGESDASPIDHTQCIKVEVFGGRDAHTHEGAKGAWVFPDQEDWQSV